jgi:hypothetical protein
MKMTGTFLKKKKFAWWIWGGHNDVMAPRHSKMA